MTYYIWYHTTGQVIELCTKVASYSGIHSYIVMVYIVTAYTVMVYIVMAYIVTVYIVTAYIVMAR